MSDPKELEKIVTSKPKKLEEPEEPEIELEKVEKLEGKGEIEIEDLKKKLIN